MRDERNKIAGSITGATPIVERSRLAQSPAREKIDAYRLKQIPGYDGVFDAERGLFLIAGRHPTLVGVEAVIAVDLASMVTMVGSVMPTIVVPLLIAGISASRATETP